MGTYEKGSVRIHFEQAGSGFPLLVIAGGGLNSTISGLSGSASPFNPIEEMPCPFRAKRGRQLSALGCPFIVTP